uniref:exocyst complex component EXO70A1-like n=1 Tax=Erigeron canadensis TaxID=72917 RepID=UPI001CB8A55E|nr:exocyst complex component EXO70A1-like [Erigeron canadensis]
MLIGKGGYGLVFKGELLLSGKLTFVAVKRLDTNISGQGLKEFSTEIHLLTRYKHPNLVSLLGFCEEHGEKILVYDYAERGSLERYLTRGKSTVQLSWLQRLNICIDAARGLDYLHNHVAQDHRVIHRDIKSANILLSRFNMKAEAKYLSGPHESLQGCNNKSFKSSHGVPSRANNLPSHVIPELEHEFKQLLSIYSKPVEPDRIYECLPSSLRPSSGSPDASNKDLSNSHTAAFNPLVLVPPRLMPVLHDLAQDMVNAGHTRQYLIIYRDARSQPLQKSLHQLGVEKLSKHDIEKMEWEVLELKIGTWIHSMRIAVKLLFAAERNLCDQMFEGIESLKDQCFVEVTQGSVDMLLSFGNAVAKSKRSPEKLFVLLDIYEIMRELHSEIEMLFSGKACNAIIEAALGLTRQLAQTVKDTFEDFEEAVEKYATRTAVADGTVHPLTSYVINYVKFLFDYQSTLKQLFQEFEKGDDSNAQLASVTMRIMQALQTNLEEKSKQYKDPALTNLFLVNNIHYMVRSVHRSEAKDLFGDDWVQRHRRILQQHAKQYKRIAWAKILESLSSQEVASSGGDGGNSGGASRALVKERLRVFNLQFEKLHQRQSKWTVPDLELRKALRLAIREDLLPAYVTFIERYGSLVDNGKNRHEYIKYSSEDLDRMIGEFFEGREIVKQKAAKERSIFGSLFSALKRKEK